MERRQVHTLKRSELKAKIESLKGQFFTVYFEKQDKSFRKMNGRIGVKKGTNGGRNPAEGKPHLVNMWDRPIMHHRNANISTTKILRCQKKEFVIID